MTYTQKSLLVLQAGLLEGGYVFLYLSHSNLSASTGLVLAAFNVCRLIVSRAINSTSRLGRIEAAFPFSKG
jgi:hypothetical protein